MRTATPKKRVTIQMVAREAGVSVGTVSNVLSGKRKVSDRYREPVMQAIARLDYEPSVVATSLRKGTTRLLAMVLPNIAYPLFPQMVKGAEDAASRYGYQIVVCNTEESLEREREYVRRLSRRWIDGIIFAGAGDSVSSSCVELERRQTPIVFVDRLLDAQEPIERQPHNLVLLDNVEGAGLATGHLLQLGHRRIACIRGPGQILNFQARLKGYENALRAAELEPEASLIERAPGYDIQAGMLAMRRLLTGGARPTALFASNDYLAIGAIKVAHQAGLHVPDDLAVIGFDDVEIASLYEPTLSTIAQPFYEMGALAVQVVIDSLKNPEADVQHHVLSGRLVVRQSTVSGYRTPEGLVGAYRSSATADATAL